MIKRSIFNVLTKWSDRAGRKPLLVRGGRQVGKTWAVKEFGKQRFKNVVELNFEREADRRLFQSVGDIQTQINTVASARGQAIVPGETLLFLDEIQGSAIAIQQLRYFYEDFPQLHVIAAGSLLEAILPEIEVDFPVGRVEYAHMHPLTFPEFLEALGHDKWRSDLNALTLNERPEAALHEIWLKAVLEYALIGGMPEIVAAYAKNRNLSDLDSVYDALTQGFFDDIGKYATRGQATYLRHVLQHVPAFVGLQISYAGFGESAYGSRAMAAAFQKLEQVYLLSLVRSSRSLQPPISSNLRKFPKLLHLDIGLVNFNLKQRHELLLHKSLEAVYRGQIAEQLVGQTLLARQPGKRAPVNFWYRDQEAATAELDYVIALENSATGSEIVGIEVKSGSAGTLRSLHQFVVESKVKRAVRISSAPLGIETVQAADGSPYRLISIPFYLAHRIEELLS